jgi:DNA modification methylase
MNEEKNQTRPSPQYPMAQRIELWNVDRLIPYATNARTHSAAQVSQIAASIAEFGFTCPILVDSHAGIIAGHGRLLAARNLDLKQVPVISLDHLTDRQKRAYIIADNKLAENAGWDDDALRAELAALENSDFDLELLGFGEDELQLLLRQTEQAEESDAPVLENSSPEPPADPVTRPGDLWLVGRHRLLCADCRDLASVQRLLEGAQANLVVTSPPYATQRKYDSSTGFRPVPPDDYCTWFLPVAANIAAILANDGSYFLNIKEHAEDGERSLYVKDLIIAHRRQWGWRFVDEFCWRKTDNGVPGRWHNRFKNAWEPVVHFCRQAEIQFHPKAAGHVSEDCFEYSPANPASTSGSGLLGSGPRGSAASDPSADDEAGRFAGIAWPSNVIEAKTESSQGDHSAPYPRTLVEFFVKAFSSSGDIVFDPFLGSGTTIAAAHVLGRSGYGIEISPAYCDVALRRIARLSGEEPVLLETGTAMTQVAVERGVTPKADAEGPKRKSK